MHRQRATVTELRTKFWSKPASWLPNWMSCGFVWSLTKWMEANPCSCHLADCRRLRSRSSIPCGALLHGRRRRFWNCGHWPRCPLRRHHKVMWTFWRRCRLKRRLKPFQLVLGYPYCVCIASSLCLALPNIPPRSGRFLSCVFRCAESILGVFHADFAMRSARTAARACQFC